MPLYKFVGNKILTAAAERAARHAALRVPQRLSRLLGGGAASSIPFQLNSNDFHFDTEIIIQLLNAGQRIVELPIPTYYGDEICRVNGMKYAKDVMLATLRERARTAPACSTSAASMPRQRAGQRALRPEARLREQPPVRARRRARRARACSTSAPGPGGIARELVEEGLPGRGRRSVHGRRSGPAGVEVFTQDLDERAALRRPRLRLPAAARRHRAPAAIPSSSSSGCARSSTTRRGRWC